MDACVSINHMEKIFFTKLWIEKVVNYFWKQQTFDELAHGQ